MCCRAATDLAIKAYMAGITPRIPVAASPARFSHRPLLLADGSLDPAQLGGEVGHAADVSVGILLRPARIAA